MAFTTVTDVSNELGGYALTASSTPTSTTVNGWIGEAEEEIVLKSGNLYGTTTITDEIQDYDGGGITRTDYAPIASITSVYKEVNGINAASESWVELTEGRILSTDFYTYKSEGEILYHGTNLPTAGYQNIKLTYIAGNDTIPDPVKRLATVMVAQRVIGAVQNNSATTEGGTVSVGTISVSDPTKFGQDHVRLLTGEISYLYDTLGNFKTFRLNRRYDQ